MTRRLRVWLIGNILVGAVLYGIFIAFVNGWI